jgi:hypothetical protein
MLVRTEVVRDLLIDIIEACRRMGFRAVLGVTGHMAGGHMDALKQVNDHYRDDPEMIVEMIPFTRIIQQTDAAVGRDFPYGLCDHGTAAETSHMWASRDARVDLSKLPPADADVPFWGLEGFDPHRASKQYGVRIQQATRRGVAAYCRRMLQRARELSPPPPAPARLMIRLSPAARQRWQRKNVEKGFFLLIQNGIRARAPYEPGQERCAVEGLHEGPWGVHAWGLRKQGEHVIGTSIDYKEIELKPGDNQIEF